MSGSEQEKKPHPTEAFDWACVIITIEEQARTCVYIDINGAVIIRQRGDKNEDDDLVTVQIANLPALLNRLHELLSEVRENA